MPKKPRAKTPHTPKTPPLLALCVIFRDNADTIDDLLTSVDGQFDEFSFVDTGSKDGTRARIEKFLRSRVGVVTDFEWCDDFSAARQVSFERATAQWRMFLDTDDRLVCDRGGLKRLLTKINDQHPELLGFFVPYKYADDENMLTMRLCKWDDQWVWKDKIHERLERAGMTRAQYGTLDPKEINVVHKHKGAEDKKKAIYRNSTIAEREYATSTDARYRARLARTIAMRLKTEEKFDEALPYLEEVYAAYATYPEGKQAAADISNIWVAKAYREKEGGHKAETPPLPGHLETAMSWGRRAGPAYEAVVYHAQRNWPEVLRAAQRSQALVQQTTHEGHTVEKGAVPVAAAEALIKMGGPLAADRAEACMNRVPPDLRSHAAILPHAMRVREGIDRITIVVPGTPQPFDENGGGGMLGGSEEAVMYLSRSLAQQGRNVRVFAPLPLHRLPGADRYGVDWQDMAAFDPDHEHGALVVWRAIQFVHHLVQTRIKQDRVFPGISASYLWLHDGGLGVEPQVARLLTEKAVDGTMVLSDFHARQIAAQGAVKLIKVANGVPREHFEDDIGKWDRDQFSVVYSSCPSRGLRHLLAMWPRVKERVPQAKLDIYYDWSMIASAQPEWYIELLADMEKVKDLGVVHHGGVDHAALNTALKRANVWAYSHFDNPTVETFCISAVKASAAGATVLTVPNGAVPEVAPDSLFCVDPGEYERTLVGLLEAPMDTETRVGIARRALDTFAWDVVARRFSDVWTVKRIKESAAPRATV